MNTFRLLLVGAASALLIAAAAHSPLRAQPVPSNPPPYNIAVGNGAALLSPTVAVANTGTIESASQNNLSWNGVQCTFKQTASSGSASTVMSIIGYDAATAVWNIIGQTSAIVGPSSTAGNVLQVYPGIATSSTPTGFTGASAHLPRTWRVRLAVGGSASITGSVGCNYLR